MSSITPHTTHVKVPPGTDHEVFDLDIPGLDPSATGWVWHRPRPTWFEAQALPSLASLKELTVHMLLVRSGDEYVCVLPVSSATALANISRRGHESDGKLVLNVRGASHQEAGHAAVVITRTHSERYIAALPRVAVAEARKWLLKKPVAYQAPRLGPMAGVGFCTWNALHEGRNVYYHTIAHLVDTLVRARMPIQSFIIDDGWHDIRHFRDNPEDDDRRRGLWSFGTKRDFGDDGLKGIVKLIKQKLESVESTGKTEVGAWIALTGGYWDGVHPDSPLVERYGCVKYAASRQWWRGCPPDPLEPNHMPSGKSFYVLPPPERAAEFWTDWFTILRDAGISFLKIDNQAAVTALDGVDGVGEALAIWEAMYTVAETVFGAGRVIHCMSHSEAIWAGAAGLGLTTRGERFVWRNSDDFGLEGRSPYAHQQHIFTNLMNALVSNAMCTIPDADMFMTTRQYPHAHALLRALFPGPLLLSDRPGEHDSSLLWRLVARNKQGKAVVLRPSHAPEPLARRVMDTGILDYEEGSGLWAAVRVGGVTIMGVWNVRGGVDRPIRVDDIVTVQDVEDALGHEIDDDYVVTRLGVQHASVLAATVVSRNTKGELGLLKDLPMLGAASYWVAKVQRLPVGGIAVLGLIDHFTGPAALHSVALSSHTIHVQLKCAGRLGTVVAAPHRPSATALVDGRPETVLVRPLPSLSGAEQGVFLLTVDVGHTIPNDKRVLWDVRVSIQ